MPVSGDLIDHAQERQALRGGGHAADGAVAGRQHARHGVGGETAAAEHRTLVSKIDKAIKTGALHRNTGARKKSRAARILRPPAATE